jgi:hypothetical protein
VVEFEVPRPEERLALWQRAPNGEPLLDELDWSYLARRLNMTGAEIKGTALGAAVLTHPETTAPRPRWLAGAPGFEPGNGGIKIRLEIPVFRPSFRKIAPKPSTKYQ